MPEILIFTGEEKRFLTLFSEDLYAVNKKYYSILSERKTALENLGEIVSGMPAIGENLGIGKEKRSRKTLIDNITKNGLSKTINLPAKSLLGRSFTVVKMNFFALILKICNTEKQLYHYKSEFQIFFDKVIFTLLSEDVYISIIENNYPDSQVVKKTTEELVFLWENRLDKNTENFASALISLWRERIRIVPALGTLQGTVEIIQLASRLPPLWGDFIFENSQNRELANVLEEFIFNLSYENISFLRDYMKNNNINVLNRISAKSILKKYSTVDFIQEPENDSIDLYRFFQNRNEKATVRRLTGSAGPEKTLEEFFLAYIIKNRIKKWTWKKHFSKKIS